MQKLAVVVVCFSCLLTNGLAEDITAPQLTEDQVAAMQQINAGRVISTVSFLSSDELAGRDTPSRELTIASAYVAARFRGAGLEGLEKDGSFFQVHQFAMSQPTSEALLTMGDGEAKTPVKVFGVLNSAEEALDFTGTVLAEADALAAPATDTPQIAIIDELVMPPQASGRTGLVVATLSRRLRAFSAKGVKLVLMKCGNQSVLPEVARALQQAPIANNVQLRPKCAVILVDESAELVGKELAVKVGAQESVSVPVRNVVGVVRGTDETLSKQAILVSAHLDHIGIKTSGEDLVNNGADDNATGVTAVLAMADAFAALKQRPKRSVIFVTFWGEEKGLLGSKQFTVKPSWPLGDIAANVNIEMVGRPETGAREKMWMTGWKHSNLGSLMNVGAQRAGVEVFNREDVGEMLYTRSDNYPFVQKGVVAHSFSAGSLHSDYHQPGDEWEKLDVPHMTKVIQGLFAGVLFLADATAEIVAAEK